MIHWWQTTFGEEEIEHVVRSMRNRQISQGAVTAEFEARLGEYLGVKNVVATSSGSTALLLALMAVGVGPGDEVIVPNRTWIATAHAAHLLGAKVVLVDVEPDRPIIDVAMVEERITSKTKAIMPVHMNGRSADMRALKTIAGRHGIFVIEDAAQALGSRNEDGYLGCQSDVGCFSLSVAKTIATGQGGFAVTNNTDLAGKLRAIRTHGVENVKDPGSWVMPGFNFRFTDIQASIGIEQLKRLPERLEYHRNIYRQYLEGLAETTLAPIKMNIGAGEVPVYIEYIASDRSALIQKLENEGIETRPFYPDLDRAPYLAQDGRSFPNSRKYGDGGLYLPCGPAQSQENIERVIKTIRKYSPLT
ncbi:MAG: DegT/DnrJ/EryC1/StrS family aminotransferase [Spirochaetia bacterium]|nr:DegT/DnrJ/EryC1/StrS family aminotransferase [Spirochaetia bacterium]